MLLTLSTGCPKDRIDFETDTVVFPDGSVTRTTRYRVTGPNTDEYETPFLLEDGTHVVTKTNKGKLKASYAIPDGGTWHSYEKKNYDESGRLPGQTFEERLRGEVGVELTQLYSVVAHYAPGVDVPSDHVRFGKTEGHVVRNEIELDVQNYFFVKSFHFQEAYRDTSGRKRLREEVARLYPVWTAALADALASNLDGVTTARASRAVRSMVDPWYQKFMNGIYIEEMTPEDEAVVSELIVRLPPPSEDQTEIWRQKVKEASEKSLEVLNDEALFEALYGVYESCLFSCTEHGFTQTLSMPGLLVSTNATSTRGDLLVWEFDKDAFLAQDYVLEARSRIVYPARIAGASIATVLALLGFNAIRARRGR